MGSARKHDAPVLSVFIRVALYYLSDSFFVYNLAFLQQSPFFRIADLFMIESKNMPNTTTTSPCCFTPTKSIHLVDGFVMVFTLSLYTMYMLVLRKSKVIHANLKLILTIISTLDISILLVQIADFLNVSGQYDFGPTLQNWMKMIFFSMAILSLYNLLAERTVALLANQWYGRPESARPQFIVTIFLLQFISVLITYKTAQNGGTVAPEKYVAVLFSFAAFALVATLIYFLLARIRNNCAKTRRFSISGQYQMAENQRCDHVIVIYIPYQVFSFFVTTLLGGYLVFQVQQKNPRTFMLCQSLLYLTIAPRVMISMLIPVARHPALYKRFRRLIGLPLVPITIEPTARTSLKGQRSPCQKTSNSTDQPELTDLFYFDQTKFIVRKSIHSEQETDVYSEEDSADWGYTAEWNTMSR